MLDIIGYYRWDFRYFSQWVYMVWKPTSADLTISTIIAIVFPLFAGYLYEETGALLPMIFYYGLAWGIVKWRRGSTGYFNTSKKRIPISFLINVLLILLSLAFAYHARIINHEPNILGVIMTAIIWAPLNAASEQLLWIYIFEAWDLRGGRTNRIIGLLLFSTFVGLIHVFFWVNFLHTINSKVIAGIIAVFLTTLSGYVHIFVWRESNHMGYTFIPHLLLNLVPLFWTGYNIFPYLLA